MKWPFAIVHEICKGDAAWVNHRLEPGERIRASDIWLYKKAQQHPENSPLVCENCGRRIFMFDRGEVSQRDRSTDKIPACESASGEVASQAEAEKSSGEETASGARDS